MQSPAGGQSLLCILGADTDSFFINELGNVSKSPSASLLMLQSWWLTHQRVVLPFRGSWARQRKEQEKSKGGNSERAKWQNTQLSFTIRLWSGVQICRKQLVGFPRSLGSFRQRKWFHRSIVTFSCDSKWRRKSPYLSIAFPSPKKETYGSPEGTV